MMTTIAAPISEADKSQPIAPEFASSLTAVTKCEIGLNFTFRHCRKFGKVSAGTKVLKKNVSGNSTSMEIPCTLEAVRAMTPKKAKIQLIAQAQTITKSPASTT
ncbi:hypothetical protein LSPCS325_17490 [Lysinibacillus sp. CTST325]